MVDSSGNLLGVINFEIDADYLLQDLMRNSIPTADLFLVDLKTSMVIYHPKVKRQVQHHISQFDENNELVTLLGTAELLSGSELFKCSKLGENFAVCVKIDSGTKPSQSSLKAAVKINPKGLISSQMVPEFGFNYRYNKKTETSGENGTTVSVTIDYLNAPYVDVKACNWFTKIAPVVFECSTYADAGNVEGLVYADSRNVQNQVSKSVYLEGKRDSKEGFVRKCMYGARMGGIQSVRVIDDS